MGEFAFESAWDHDGGHVFTTTPVHERLLTLIGKLVRSPKRSFLRHNLLSAFNAYILGTTTYGTPGFDRETAREVLRAGKMGKLSQEHIDLSPEAEETLHDLGYL